MLAILLYFIPQFSTFLGFNFNLMLVTEKQCNNEQFLMQLF